MWFYNHPRWCINQNHFFYMCGILNLLLTYLPWNCWLAPVCSTQDFCRVFLHMFLVGLKMQYGPRADGPLSLWDITLLEGKDSIGPALQHWNDMRPKTFTLIFRQLERDCPDVLLHVYLKCSRRWTTSSWDVALYFRFACTWQLLRREFDTDTEPLSPATLVKVRKVCFIL